MRPREIHRRDDIGGRFRGDGVDARARRPGANQEQMGIGSNGAETQHKENVK